MTCSSGFSINCCICLPFPSKVQSSILSTRFYPVRSRRSHQFLSERIPFVVSSVLKTPPSVTGLMEDDVMQSFLKERESSGDFISKLSDRIWLREFGNFNSAELTMPADSAQSSEEAKGDETEGGFLKLTRTREWLLGGISAPANKKVVTKEIRNDGERKKRLNLLKYDALKRELLLLTMGIGTACSGYCLVVLSIQAAMSYAAGVLFSCLYLQLLYQYADDINKGTVPQIFLRKKSKKIGIRSQDLEDAFESSVNGSIIALSSPRLMIPVAIYGLWELSQHFGNDLFDFQLVPAIFGMLAYKAAAFVQVYRDNENLQLVLPDNEEASD